jgi:N-glycosylase/DNA lyase
VTTSGDTCSWNSSGAHATGPLSGADPWWWEVWTKHHQRFAEIASPREPLDEDSLRRELVFCLLSGHGVRYEHAASAAEILATLAVFDRSRDQVALEQEVSSCLSQRAFLPLRRDGSRRRYRYPTAKARIIAGAVTWVHESDGLVNELTRRHCTASRRTWLCSCPGIGLKTASWLLRNGGWSDDVAIIDVHILRALTEAGVIAGAELPRDYLRVEQAYLNWCRSLAASPASLDLFLWEVQRSTTPPVAFSAPSLLSAPPG